jgi:ParB family chromosome partitioning protein
MDTQELIVKNIPLKNLIEDPENPRTVFDGIEELAQSIKQQGLLSPLTVRTNGKEGHYMIVAGARRYRAAKSAKVLFVPCIIRTDLSDTQVREVQITENLQRADIHPLDESLALAKLLELHQGDGIAGIAAKIARPEAYIRRRLALGNLIEPFRKLFREGSIQKPHANLICPLTEEEQKLLLKEFANRDFSGQSEYNSIPTPAQLRRMIQRDFFLALAEAPFDTKSDDLVPKAGSCLACPKRTGNNPALFLDIKEKDTCSDPACYHKKIDVFIERLDKTVRNAQKGTPLLLLTLNPSSLRSEFKSDSKEAKALKPSQWKRAKAGECKTIRKGIIIEEYYGDRKELYKVLTVCADKGCAEHWGPNAKPSEDDSDTRRKVEDKAKMEKIKKTIAQRREVADALMEASLKPLDEFMLREVATALYKHISSPYRKQFASRFFKIEPVVSRSEYATYKDSDPPMLKAIEGMNTKELSRCIVMGIAALDALYGASSYQYTDDKNWGKTTLNRIAEHYGLDPKRIKPEKKERK